MTDSIRTLHATTDTELQLKKGFRELFPEYASELAKARSDEEVEALRQKFVRAEIEKLRGVLDEETLAQLSGGGGLAIALTPTQYNNLVNSTGDAIKIQLQTMVNGLQYIKNISSPTTDQVAAQMLATGVGAMVSGIAAFNSALDAGVTLALAAAAGVEAVTVAGIVGIVSVAIVSILIPVIYFMLKPAACFVLVINELTTVGQLTLTSTYNVHGKNVNSTPQIPNGTVFPGETYVNAGFMVTSKKEDALVGAQSGFVYSYDGNNFAFGVECPLTSIDVDNNCWCAVDQTAEDAAQQTDSVNAQTYNATGNGYTLSINCNSGSGSVAYYIARVRALG